MKRPPDPAYERAATVAREVSEALEGGTLPRPFRTEARSLLLQAFLVKASGRDRTPAPEADRLARRMDALLARARGCAAIPAPQRLPRTVRVRAVQRLPLDARIQAFEDAVRRLARRTDRMVEHALAAAGEGVVRPPSSAVQPPRGGPDREPFELVWGETEGR